MKRRSIQNISRRGRTKPAPYTKYQKAPYQYSAGYYAWRRSVTKHTAKQAQTGGTR
jgi:hypothetical protein